MVYIPPVRRSPLPLLLTVCAVLLICLVGAVFTLWGMGVIDLPFLRRVPPPPTTAGLVAVPLVGQPIPRYTRVTRDFLFNPKTGRPMVIYLKPEEITPKMLTRMDQILGKVVKKDKAVGYAFTEDDFFPKGTTEGVAGGIPPGKQALAIEAAKVYGIDGLRQGDRFDLVGALNLDEKKNAPNGLLTPFGPVSADTKTVAVRVLVQNGVVVVPLTNREVATGQLVRGKPKTKVVPEVVIALDPAEAAPLAAALAIKTQVTCFPRSGRPEDAEVGKDLVAVHVPGQPIPRYTRVTRAHLLSPLTGKPMVLHLKPSEVSSKMLTRLDQVLGRVVKHDQAASTPFSEDDFFPVGTPEGIAAGIPPGKLALPIDASKIQGIHALRQGDRFDALGAVVPEDKQGAAKGMVTRIGVSPPAQKHATVRVLIHNGIVVVPATTREVPGGQKPGGAAQTKAASEVVIAIDPEEVAPLTAALALKTEVTCFPRSGREDPEESPRISVPQTAPARRYIEFIRGSKRQLLEYTVPAPPPMRPRVTAAPDATDTVATEAASSKRR